MCVCLSQARVKPVTFYGFGTQLARVYTRPVHKEFQERQKSGTTFIVKPDPDKPNYYHVTHSRPPTDFPWLQHSYSVKAIVNEDIPEESIFNCECMRLEHTGKKNKLPSELLIICNY
jgi:hypothetical protein